MKKLGKLIILTTVEYESLACRCESAEAAAGDFAEELNRTHAKLESDMQAAFYSGKFHAAGGYSHTLPRLKEELRQAKEQIARYQPIAEIFQPSDTLVSLLQDTNGVSDADAAADFEIVGQQVRREGARA